jgi:hypothetical protein
LRKYWSDYLSTSAISIRSRIESSGMLYAIKAEAEEKTRRFKKGSIVNFPWEVLIANAQAQQDLMFMLPDAPETLCTTFKTIAYA